MAVEGGAADLAPGASFTWRTFGLSLRSRVEEFAPPRCLAWSAEGSGVRAYHVWLIGEEPSGCHVLTEETQNGWVARLGASLRPNNMKEKHQSWLEGLKARAESGPPQ